MDLPFSITSSPFVSESLSFGAVTSPILRILRTLFSDLIPDVDLFTSWFIQ